MEEEKLTEFLNKETKWLGESIASATIIAEDACSVNDWEKADEISKEAFRIVLKQLIRRIFDDYDKLDFSFSNKLQ